MIYLSWKKNNADYWIRSCVEAKITFDTWDDIGIKQLIPY